MWFRDSDALPSYSFCIVPPPSPMVIGPPCQFHSHSKGGGELNSLRTEIYMTDHSRAPSFLPTTVSRLGLTQNLGPAREVRKFPLTGTLIDP